LERAEFVVVQEAIASTATCAYADLLLPATTWGEKEGTVTNSERRISRVRAAVPAPGEARHDWQIAVAFARRLEAPDRPTLFDYTTPESIWNEHRESTRGRDLDITGMCYALLEASPQQWPLAQGQTRGAARLYEDGVFPTSDGRAQFCATPYRPVAEPRESRFPFSLTTGRLRDQWHGMSRTGTIGRLFGHVAEPVLEMHPQDMARRQLVAGALVQVSSKRGSIVVPLQPSAALGLGQVFMAMHWGEEFLSGRSAQGERLAGINMLTTSATCPDSKQPEFKHAAVKVTKATLDWQLLAMAWLPASQALTIRAQLQALMAQFAFSSCAPFANEAFPEFGSPRMGLLFRAADANEPSAAVIDQLEALLRLDEPAVLRYADTARGQRRAARLRCDSASGEALLDAFLLAGDIRAQAWMTTLLKDGLSAQGLGSALLAARTSAPVDVASRGQVVCTCFNVTDVQIDKHLACVACADLGDANGLLIGLQKDLGCGTNCGSCLPELRRKVSAAMAPAPLPAS
jgi:assimilatory nitrate reductase catalytic subunit